MPMRARVVWCLGVIVGAVLPGIAVAQPAAEKEPTLATVLSRAGDYVLRLQLDLSGLVAEEHYSQDVLRQRIGIGPPIGRGGFTSDVRQDNQHRDLKSDLLLVRPKDAERYVQFRDVFEVDGTRVRDRDDRLATLFLHPAQSSTDQLREIAEESARYNIGNISRDLNVPVLALMFLLPGNQPRFAFSVAKVGSAGQPWEIAYREVQPQTVIRTTGDRDLPVRGRFRIDPTSGRVWMTELVAEDATVHADVTVDFRFVPTFGFLVPEEMRESVWTPRGGAEIKGKATYTRFRRFQVTVDEVIAPIKE